jgi:hypothetical protein
MAVTSAGADVGAGVFGIPAAATSGRSPACLQNVRRVGSVILSFLQYGSTLLFHRDEFRAVKRIQWMLPDVKSSNSTKPQALEPCQLSKTCARDRPIVSVFEQPTNDLSQNNHCDSRVFESSATGGIFSWSVARLKRHPVHRHEQTALAKTMAAAAPILSERSVVNFPRKMPGKRNY